MNTDIFERLESNVRRYCRSFPAVFEIADGATIHDEGGQIFLDFFSGAGALNYGHNPPALRDSLIDYLRRNGIAHALDMSTVAKREFLCRFEEIILAPRGLNYKIQFTAPTGADAVEAALKLARRVTRRRVAAFFQDAYHGLTLGALAVTANPAKRGAAGVPLGNSVMLPYDGDSELDSIDYFEYIQRVSDPEDRAAAVIVETIQAEGGIKVARNDWLRRLEKAAKACGCVFIVDDIQTGCGRTGPFFSFEEAGLDPDMICMSKSISGMGLPMALLLLRPELDAWMPGEHAGTFRGNNLAFVTASAALSFWENSAFQRDVEEKGRVARQLAEDLALQYPSEISAVRGRGLLLGVVCRGGEIAARVARQCFEEGLILETAGRDSDVIKIMPPLTILPAELNRGMAKIERSLDLISKSISPPVVPTVSAASAVAGVSRPR